ncbi:hypothetical protein MspRI1_17330 [Marinobacter sp. RI1]
MTHLGAFHMQDIGREIGQHFINIDLRHIISISLLRQRVVSNSVFFDPLKTL